MMDFNVNELINDTRVILIRKFNRNPIFDGNLIGLIESYDRIDKSTIIFGKHYRYFNQIKFDRDTVFEIYRSHDLVAFRYMLKQKIRMSYIRDLLTMAYTNYHVEIIDLIIQNDPDNLNTFFYLACRGSHIKGMKYLLKYKPSNLNTCLLYAVGKYNMLSAGLLIRSGANNLNECLIIASDKGYDHLIELLSKSGASNLNECLMNSCINQQYFNIEQLIHLGATNVNECLEIAKASQNKILIELLQNKK